MKKVKPDTYKVFNTDGEVTYVDSRTHKVRRRWWTKARIPGTVRTSRKPGGSGFRGFQMWNGCR